MPDVEEHEEQEAPAADPPKASRFFRVVWELGAGYRGKLALILLLAFLATAADLLQPLIYRQAINDVAGLFVTPAEDATPGVKEPHTAGYVAPRSPEQTFRTLLQSVGLMFLLSVTGYWLSLKSDYLGSFVASRMEAKLILDTFGHVLRLPLDFFTRRASASLSKRIDQADQLSPVVHAFSQQIAPEAVRLIGISAIMLTQNWEMALVSMALLPPYLWLGRRSAMRLRTGLEPYYELWENLSARITDALTSIKTVKLSGAEAREEKRLGLESHAAYDVYLARIRTAQGYYLSQSILSNCSRALVLGYGGWLVLRHRLTPGDVVMFAAYLERLYGPIDSLNNIAASLAQHMASIERALKLRDEGPIEDEGNPLTPSQGRVEFRDVHFGYVPDQPVLKGLTLTLEPGKITALAGPSGAGKTTTADLLLKLYSPSSGEILLDNQPLSASGPAPVRRAIGVVAADGAVFRGTLADNIRYKRPEATDEEVLVAARAAGLSRAIARLPEGIHTEIGERGMGLSVGERQRLQIARMLADHPRVLVLDEATANLDYATELEVKQALLELSPRPTMLVIAHRYTMMKEADYVYILREGRVSEHGTPAQLIAAGGWFAELAHQSGAAPEPAP